MSWSHMDMEARRQFIIAYFTARHKQGSPSLNDLTYYSATESPEKLQERLDDTKRIQNINLLNDAFDAMEEFVDAAVHMERDRAGTMRCLFEDPEQGPAGWVKRREKK